MQPDPFRNDDPRWEHFEIAHEDAEFSQPDLASRHLGDFLREIVKRLPPQPLPVTPDLGGRLLPHIHGYSH